MVHFDFGLGGEYVCGLELSLGGYLEEGRDVEVKQAGDEVHIVLTTWQSR